MKHDLVLSLVPRTTITFIIMLISSIIWAQEGTALYSASPTKVIDHSSYDAIKGSPYLYDEWYPAKVLGSDGKFYDFEKVNFNGFTHELETKTDGKIEQIMPRFYINVVVNTGANKDTFLKGIHTEFARTLICVIYNGPQVKFIKRFSVRIEKAVMQTPGVPTEFEKFSRSEQYYLMINGKLTSIKLKKKSIIALLGHKSEVEKYLKQEKNSLKSEAEISRFLAFYETL